MSSHKVAVVVGDGRMAAECARIVSAHELLTLGTIIHHGNESRWASDIEKVSRELHVPHLTVGNVNDETAVRTLEELRPDVVFSANNWDIIRPRVLEIPADGIINFHNGPLPHYRGVNVPSWAIFNGERRYGVAWHYVDEKLDTGDLVATTSFELKQDETAISLIFRCIEAGIDLLPSLLDRYVDGKLSPVPQEGSGRYFRAGDVPNDGYLDFSMSFERLSALVRALSFRPFPSPMSGPRIRVGQHVLPVGEVAVEGRPKPSERWKAGEILGVDERGIRICSADSLLRVTVLEDAANEKPLGPERAGSYGLTVGSVL